MNKEKRVNHFYLSVPVFACPHLRPLRFRESGSTRLGTRLLQLRANREDVKTAQELLRHANSRITLDIYTQAISPSRLEA
jgi:integrase